MNHPSRTEPYHAGDHVYAKEHPSSGQVRFTKDGKPPTLAAWSQKPSRFQSMLSIPARLHPSLVLEH
jgi:hypothetical protein